MLALAVFLVACGGEDNDTETDTGNDVVNNETETDEPDPQPEISGGAIAVISREEGSGSRGAFEELLEFNLEEDGSDAMTADAIIATGNGGVATAVVENDTAIGYISLVTLLDRQGELVGLYIDGVAPTAENMLSGAYTLTRPFNVVYLPDTIGDVERAFIEFAQSVDGLDVLENNGVIVDRAGAEPFDMAAHGSLSGSLLFGGSTSTEATATALAEEFTALFPGVDIQYSATGSGAGISGATDGTYALGFASREIRDTELETGLNVVEYAVDGIVVAVNPASGITGLTLEQLRAIYVGDVTDWSEVQ